MRFKSSLRAPSRGSEPNLSRRSFLTRTGIAATGALLFPSFDTYAYSLSRERTLYLYNKHTGEDMTLVCCPERNYDRALLRQFSHFLRDHHVDESHPMDPGLIDILYAISAMTRSNGTFEIISGYRAPETNRMLRRHSHGVAEHSLHMEGKAIDLRMSDVSTRTIRKIALALQYGGVGYYRRADFVHLDTGRIRAW
ncbi:MULTISPECIES: YcbK family protein [Methylococcus]|uniref:Murein endopeptidase K n=1 Tax=Methylococcus capsulatus TaxID=414 RepID=A0ABZ2F285_METCP|nr:MULTISPECIES: DUF882 domain-containing protein [Methylococcus]MDF9391467.1 DUF882 domain-containing protein [Methylococcus capsulatus]